jgi:tripartite-type tricarboxylate transporter receptor subunit TctC
VSIVSSSPEVLVVSPALPVTTFPELVVYGKANPGKLNFASAGIGTTPHLAGEMFKLRTGSTPPTFRTRASAPPIPT